MTHDSAIRRAKQLNKAYRDLRLSPGARVRYHGTVRELHGQWTVHPCNCHECTYKTLLGLRATRYALRTADGQPGLIHVRHTSVTPVPTPEELGQAGIWLVTKYVAAHLRKQLRETFPGAAFSVRCGRGKKSWEIDVSWTGGPSEHDVRVVTAPLLAGYGTPDQCRPRPVTVTVAGRVRHGIPRCSAINLVRVPG
ncbi:LPD29 domain-containing protein [Streptomyces luteireticuli]|uniref:LPD29 domain-containing protein n=1 Tax=Streptomyces luteireticuli TaxID=173858 RepID=UPI003557BC84